MNIVLLRVPLTLGEINKLTHEFPQLLFLSYPESQLKKISKEHWAKVEILFGEKLTEEELSWAEALKWIHSPSTHLFRLPMEAIAERENMLVTCTKQENATQIAEYVMGIALSFAKNFFKWKEAMTFPALIWDAKWRDRMESLTGKVWLQIGMDKAGTEIAKQASERGMRVISIDKERNFHPYCKKNLSIHDLHSVLPYADVVSVVLPKEKDFAHWFTLKELKLMKENAILSLIGPTPLVDAEAHEAIPYLGRLRGVAIDASYFTPISPNSPLWDVPNLLITPGVAGRPASKGREAVKLFRSNLRDYMHGNFLDMRWQVDTSLITR